MDVEAIAYNVQQIQARIRKETLTLQLSKGKCIRAMGFVPVVERLLPSEAAHENDVTWFVP